MTNVSISHRAIMTAEMALAGSVTTPPLISNTLLSFLNRCSTPLGIPASPLKTRVGQAILGQRAVGSSQVVRFRSLGRARKALEREDYVRQRGAVLRRPKAQVYRLAARVVARNSLASTARHTSKLPRRICCHLTRLTLNVIP